MADTFILIPGRTSKQGCGISEGKYGENYQSEINTLRVAPPDMERLALSDGDKVRLTGEHGQIDVAVKTAKKDEGMKNEDELNHCGGKMSRRIQNPLPL